jgi:hypothetical protein
LKVTMTRGVGKVYQDDAIDVAACGDGAYGWTRSARHVQRLAAAVGRDLDVEFLILYDMRDLQALERSLSRQVRTHAGGVPAHASPASSFTLMTVLAVVLAALLPLVAPALLLAVLEVLTA